MLDRTSTTQRPRRDEIADSLLVPGRTVWRLAEAERAAVLIDAAAYFGALRQAMLAAEHSIMIVGWDIDSRTRLVGPSGSCDDGLPETLGAFLSALVKRRPRLRIRLLLWDYSMVFALQRELAPIVSFLWRTPAQIEICLDDVLPIGASHHQKLVVIDDTLAFSGGLDLTIRRWDTDEHLPGDTRRADPAGVVYPPFHDVQMAVDGEAARALAELARQRWRRAACEQIRPPRVVRRGHVPSRWPAGLEPDFRAVTIGVARTLPAHGREAPVTEVVRLFEEMVGRAERLVYIENQFVTHAGTAEALARRMAERPELEAVIVVPRDYEGWVERRVMIGGRLRFMAILETAGVHDRVRLLSPQGCADGTEEDVMVHSKVTIIDDEVLRVGSANLCNRSMGLDSECDLVIAAQDEAERAGIARVRDRLLAEHSGVPVADIARLWNEGGSMLERLDGRIDSRGRGLRRVDDASSGIVASDASLDAVADPPEPFDDDGERTVPMGGINRGLILKAGLALVVLLLLALVWQMSPLGQTDRIVQSIDAISERPWAPLAVIALFLIAECVVFPITLLVFATIAVFGGWTGAMLAMAGALASATATYGAGRYLGAGPLRRVIGPRTNRIRRALLSRGVMAVAAVRVVPLAPFTFVNLVAGASGLRFFDYIVGTAVGLTPGILVMSALGQQLADLFTDPSAGGIALLALFVLLWVVMGIGLQWLIARYRPVA
ncbi:VTT domain-containing protein [Ancylobacter sp. A5.8]|uniref:VTT domain-containing protein n=1 Tax=Ancylobacter gelatini TaxID=2919920 RepID=UPI001F4DB4E2|nr:VTT domain-containing protein [Ancylobacter gelatini]MCJ8143350.1 VTT domain-containing protein [Ancylobacter gelatini]